MFSDVVNPQAPSPHPDQPDPRQDERRSMRCDQPHRSQSPIDVLSACIAPAKQACKELPQSDQLHDLGDEDNSSKPELRAGLERAIGALRTVELDPVPALEIANASRSWSARYAHACARPDPMDR
jgi:hypothetical protein